MPNDDIKEILYGKTTTVKLADGKDYILREPDIEMLEATQVDLANMNDLRSIKKLAYVMLKQDQPNLTEASVGRLITFGMIQPQHNFSRALFSLLGIKLDEKNV